MCAAYPVPPLGVAGQEKQPTAESSKEMGKAQLLEYNPDGTFSQEHQASQLSRHRGSLDPNRGKAGSTSESPESPPSRDAGRPRGVISIELRVPWEIQKNRREQAVFSFVYNTNSWCQSIMAVLTQQPGGFEYGKCQASTWKKSQGCKSLKIDSA